MIIESDIMEEMGINILYSTPVRILTSVQSTIYTDTELGAELEINKELPAGPIELFNQLLASQEKWTRDLVEFAQFALDQTKYGKMDITIDDVLSAHDKDGYLVTVLDRLVKHIHQMSFGWVVSTEKGLHLAKSFGRCDRRGSSLRVKVVGMLSIWIFVALMEKHRNGTNIQIKYASDNLELVNRGKEHLNYNHPYPNNTLSTKYDITEQIYLTNKTYRIDVSFQHV